VSAASAAAAGNGAGEAKDVAPSVAAKIHVPDPELGDEEAAAEQDGAEAPKPKKKTRRGTRGGRGRKRKTAVAPSAQDGGEPAAEPAGEGASEWEYVPMSEWGDEIAPSEKRG